MYQGFFINLDRSTARRDGLLANLAAVGATARYERVPAVEGELVKHQYPTKLDPGNLGLWLTHCRLLEANRGSQVHLHVLEDDAVLISDAVRRYDRILQQADVQLPGWDIIFTDLLVPPQDVLAFRKAVHGIAEADRMQAPSMLDLKGFAFAGTTSLFINKQSINKYAGLIANQWSHGLPIDIFIRLLIQHNAIKAYVTLPFQSTVSRLNLRSEIRGTLDRSRELVTAYRCTFYEEADLPRLHAEIKELFGEPELSLRAQIYLDTIRFTISDQWQQF